MAKRRLKLLPPSSSSSSSYAPSSTYVPSTYTVTTVVSTTIYEPEFSFYIPNSEFYINTPAVSVSDITKSRTNFNDSIFYFLNKNNVPLYYKSIDITQPTITNDIVSSNAQIANRSVFNPVGKIRASFVKSSNKVIDVIKDETLITTDEAYTYIPFIVSYKGNRLGQIILRVLNIYYNNPGIMVYPFESIPFAASYVSDNVGDLDKLYFGKTVKSLNKNLGTIDFTFYFQYYDVNPFDTTKTATLKYQPVVISLNTVNTGYVPSTINLASSPPPTGGYTPPASYYASGAVATSGGAAVA